MAKGVGAGAARWRRGSGEAAWRRSDGGGGAAAGGGGCAETVRGGEAARGGEDGRRHPFGTKFILGARRNQSILTDASADDPDLESFKDFDF